MYTSTATKLECGFFLIPINYISLALAVCVSVYKSYLPISKLTTRTSVSHSRVPGLGVLHTKITQVVGIFYVCVFFFMESTFLRICVRGKRYTIRALPGQYVYRKPSMRACGSPRNTLTVEWTVDTHIPTEGSLCKNTRWRSTFTVAKKKKRHNPTKPTARTYLTQNKTVFFFCKMPRYLAASHAQSSKT